MGFLSFRRALKSDLAGRQAERRLLLARALGPHPRLPNAIDTTKSVAHQLIDAKLLEPEQARAAGFEAKARSLSLPTVLAEIGAVPQQKIFEIIETTNAALLASSLDYDVRLPRHILLENKVCIHAQTPDRIVISTMGSFNLVRQLLTPFVKGRKVIEVPFRWDKWAEFEQGISKIMEPGEDNTNFHDPANPRSVVPEGTEDAEILDILVDRATVFNASDIHIEPSKTYYAVYFRSFGIRTMVHAGGTEEFGRLLAMIKDRSRLDPMETRVPQDGSFGLKVRGRPFDVRVATCPTDGAEKVTMRLLDPVRAQMRLKQLGITEVDTWREIVGYRNGIVLIVGSTGSGKTTTLNATVREMDRFAKCIYTAEDPVEYRIPYVSHVQMNETVGLDFARAIKAFMRGDPDIIILGEIRDNMTASKAIQAAETGHLVIATIHAESVPMALQRLRGLNVRIEDIENLMRGIMVQFLIRTLCTSCGGTGCNTCNGSGYNGRTVVSEIAKITSPLDVHRIMLSDKDHSQRFWVPLYKDLETKILTGLSDGREVYRAFASELAEMGEYSEVLRNVYAEERAKRGIVAETAAAAQINALPQEEKLKQRRLSRAKVAGSVPGGSTPPAVEGPAA